jgi:hypothetical protein
MKKILTAFLFSVMFVGCPNESARPAVSFREILIPDENIATLNSRTIVRAYTSGNGWNTVLELDDGRTIIVRGYKGHNFYEQQRIELH